MDMWTKSRLVTLGMIHLLPQIMVHMYEINEKILLNYLIKGHPINVIANTLKYEVNSIC